MTSSKTEVYFLCAGGVCTRLITRTIAEKREKYKQENGCSKNINLSLYLYFALYRTYVVKKLRSALAKTKMRRLYLCCKKHTRINTQIKAHRHRKQTQGHILTCMFSKTTLNSHYHHVTVIRRSTPRAESTYLSKVKI